MTRSQQNKLEQDVTAILTKELKRLQETTMLGFEVNVEWLPGETAILNGKKLLEQVQGDTIFIYSENPQKALSLLQHGFAEWLLNQNSYRYRQLINSLIGLFEDQQYENKEKIISAIEKIMVKNIVKAVED